MMKILFLFCVIIASPVHADIFKCPMAGGKVAYQSKPCKSGVEQDVIKGNKSEYESDINSLMSGGDGGTYVSNLQALYDGYSAYVKEFGDEAQPFDDALTGLVKVTNYTSNGLSMLKGQNLVNSLKSIHEEMKQKNIPSLEAYYDYKEKEVSKQQAIDEQNRLQEEANRIARQQQFQQSIRHPDL